MRILHILDHSLPVQDGYAYRTLNLMRAQQQAGWEVAGLTTPRQYDSEAEATAETYVTQGLTFYRTPPSALPHPSGLREIAEMVATYRRLRTVIATFKPDILHAHSPVLTVLPAIRAARQAGIKVVYEIRAFWEDAAVDMGHTHEISVRYKLTRWLETQACQRVDAVGAICDGLQADLAQRGLNKPVHVLPNCVDAEKFTPISQRNTALAHHLGLTPEVPVLGFIGSFYKFEGLDLLIEAVKQLSHKRPVQLLLVGGGQMDTALRAQASDCPHILFTGRVPQDQVRAYYSVMDALVYPRHSIRLTQLVTPLKPLETMALGKPVIASDVGGHRELIQDQRTGLLFKAGDSTALQKTIETAISNPELLAKLGQTGRAYVEEARTWSRYPEIIKETGFYSTVLKN